jgi:hypothetical protein
MNVRSTLLMFSAVLSGCVTAHPTDSLSDIEQRARSTLPSTTGRIEFIHTGSWVPQTVSMAAVISITNPAKLVQGVLAMTDDGISFLAWDKSKARYTSRLFIPSDDVGSVTTSESWRTKGKLIVIERKGKYAEVRGIGTAQKGGGFEGFLVTSPRGVGDEEATDTALAVLKDFATK